MDREILQDLVYRLSLRVQGLGLGADIYALTLSELWGVYAFLRRLAGE